MSDLSWNEIRARAAAFAREWEGETNEKAEAKTFWDDFFRVFGIHRRRIGAAFEHAVKKQGGAQGFVDLFWKGVLVVEHKSRGRDLDRAAEQARDYFPGLRDDELPRYVLVSDFARFRLYDLGPPVAAASDAAEAPAPPLTFALAELPAHVERFAFLLGRERRTYAEQDPVNVEAAQRMGALHDRLREAGYTGHSLDVYLVRLLFCLFADDTGLFERGAFADLVDRRSRDDGADLARLLAELFEVLDTPPEARMRTLDPDLAAFPYVNGGLFAERLPTAAFDAAMRAHLLGAGSLDWGAISPAIFGSLFQSAMDPEARRALGAHYTSEANIQKLLGPLLFDGLRRDLARALALRQNAERKRALAAFLDRVAAVTLLDPACGCGNFLVVAYRELRTLELDALRGLYADDLAKGLQVLDIAARVRVNVGQCFGLEVEDFPAQIAAVALWLTDHQMNLRASEAFGTYFARLPLTQSAHVRHANALRVPWATAFGDEQPAAFTAILGNPPFVGKHYQSADQRSDLRAAFEGEGVPAGDLDFVAAWYILAARYMAAHPETRTAFVSTNSVTQGEQVASVWGPLLNRYGMQVQFAHRTFKWTNEAPGRAAVHVVIAGFGKEDVAERVLVEYDRTGAPHVRTVRSISPYLVEGPALFVTKRTKPLANIPAMRCGNKPSDGGNLVLDAEAARALIAEEPGAAPFVRAYVGSEEFINGRDRFCLWLKDIPPATLRALPRVRERVERVRAMRQASTAVPTQRAAATSTLFFYVSQPETAYLAIPEVSSESRDYIPMGFLPPDVIASNTVFVIPSDSLYHFGVLSSAMHMAWMRTVGGRLKSDYRYSGSLVYNTFVWPEAEAKQTRDIEAAAQAVLDARAAPLAAGATLADLYDPLAMPPALAKAHAALDRAVDRAYRPSGFASEAARVAHLFDLYAARTAGLFAASAPKTRRRAAPPAKA